MVYDFNLALHIFIFRTRIGLALCFALCFAFILCDGFTFALVDLRALNFEPVSQRRIDPFLWLLFDAFSRFLVCRIIVVRLGLRRRSRWYRFRGWRDLFLVVRLYGAITGGKEEISVVIFVRLST